MCPVSCPRSPQQRQQEALEQAACANSGCFMVQSASDLDAHCVADLTAKEIAAEATSKDSGDFVNMRRTWAVSFPLTTR